MYIPTIYWGSNNPACVTLPTLPSSVYTGSFYAGKARWGYAWFHHTGSKALESVPESEWTTEYKFKVRTGATSQSYAWIGGGGSSAGVGSYGRSLVGDAAPPYNNDWDPYAGGAGAGEVIYIENFELNGGREYTIGVGAGGGARRSYATNKEGLTPDGGKGYQNGWPGVKSYFESKVISDATASLGQEGDGGEGLSQLIYVSGSGGGGFGTSLSPGGLGIQSNGSGGKLIDIGTPYYQGGAGGGVTDDGDNLSAQGVNLYGGGAGATLYATSSIYPTRVGGGGAGLDSQTAIGTGLNQTGVIWGSEDTAVDVDGYSAGSSAGITHITFDPFKGTLDNYVEGTYGGNGFVFIAYRENELCEDLTFVSASIVTDSIKAYVDFSATSSFHHPLQQEFPSITGSYGINTAWNLYHESFGPNTNFGTETPTEKVASDFIAAAWCGFNNVRTKPPVGIYQSESIEVASRPISNSDPVPPSGGGYRINNKMDYLLSDPTTGLTDEYSIEGWFNFPNSQGPNNSDGTCVLAHGNSVPTTSNPLFTFMGIEPLYETLTSTYKFRPYFKVDSVTYSGNFNTTPIDEDTWIHMVMTYNRTLQELKLYLNGVLSDTLSTTQWGVRDIGVYTTIGAEPAYYPDIVSLQSFTHPTRTGQLRVYGKELNLSEIQQNYTNTNRY
jgi:hypothetical protein